MANKRTSKLPSTRKVKASDVLAVTTESKAYGSVYVNKVEFEREALGVGPDAWIWLLLQNLVAESAVAAAEHETTLVLRKAILRLAKSAEGRRVLAQVPQHTSAADIRRLFRLSEELSAINDTAIQARSRAAFRSFVFARAHVAQFAEQIDQQRVRYKPKLPTPRSQPRPLISDLHDIADTNANTPIGALSSNTAKQLIDDFRNRVNYDLQRIREACIADMSAAAALRKRAIELRKTPISEEIVSLVREAMRHRHLVGKVLQKHEIPSELTLICVLKVIHAEGLATSQGWNTSYSVPLKREVEAKLLSEICEFKSHRIIEIEYRASVEEIFAAFHLLHTYLSWNWAAVSALRADGISIDPSGTAVFQSYKSKTDDDTPVESIDLSEPGVQMAVEILLWNRNQLVKYGFYKPTDQLLWATRSRPTSRQRTGYFHPISRLKDLIKRHNLQNYSLEQVRNQVLFNVSLQKGGIEAARLKGGHRSYGTTERYVGNILQDRISSALNLEYSKKLEKEIRYLYRGGNRASVEITLLRPIGDGSSCINPAAPPSGRSKLSVGCEGAACHLNGGCPNRRISIDDNRVEEIIRLNRHYIDNWQRLMQENPEGFVVHTIPHMAFNAALLLALQRGPYAARVMQINTRMDMS
jgi:hypothetical protein